MSAHKARGIALVEPYYKDGDTAVPRCKVTLDTGDVVALASLSRSELIRAAKLAYPNIPGNRWFKVPGDEIQELLRGELRPIVAQVTVDRCAIGVPKDAPEPEIPDQRSPIPVEPEPVPYNGKLPHEQQGDAAGQLASLIAQLAGASVDEAQVRSIVKTELDRAIDDLPIKRVEVEFRTPRETQPLPEQHHKVTPEVIQVVGVGLNVFLVGPAGTGKSTIAHQCADALGLSFYALSFGPTTPTSKLFGYLDANGNYVRTPFREAYEHGGLFLGDELDNGHPGLIAELNQATSNGYCAFADGMVKRHDDFRLVVTGNTFGTGPDRLFVGRNILDAATLDRFVTIEVPTDEDLERALAYGHATDETRDQIARWVAQVQGVRAKANDAKLPVVVSPRASIDGARLIAAGMPYKRVEETRLWKGMSPATRKQLS